MRRTFFTTVAALAALFASSAMAQEKSLTVYTYESFVAEWGPGPKVKAAFEETCGCTVEWVGVADGVGAVGVETWLMQPLHPLGVGCRAGPAAG